MKIIKKYENDGKVTTKGIVVSTVKTIYFGVHIKNKKGIYWDNKYFSFSNNITKGKSTAKGIGISFMRYAFFVSWSN